MSSEDRRGDREVRRLGWVLAVALAVTLAGSASSIAGAGAASARTPIRAQAQTSPSARARACRAAMIDVHRGRLGAAAGSRYLTVRVRNVGDAACRLPGWTRYRFLRHGEAIGWPSPRNRGYDPGKRPVVVAAGEVVRSVLSWVDPGPVPHRRCLPRRATGIRVHLTGLRHRWQLRPGAAVCTTRRYRPHGTRLHAR